MSNRYTRREFVGDSARLAVGAMIVPRHILGGPGYKAPSRTLNVACVGIGGMGMQNMKRLLDENIVAVCDVDFPYVERSLAGELRVREGATGPTAEAQRLRDAYTKAAKYADFREMLDKQKDIDAVVVATPDHLHAPIALAAMDVGKHVYVQKPLTWSIAEARALSRRATETKLATQMGNQGHSYDEARTAIEYVWSGAIGDVREVHIWTNRPLGYWPQGMPRPEPSKTSLDKLRWNGPGVTARIASALYGNGYSVPKKLAWNLFLGPAPHVDYHPIYHPFNWRGWVDWGVGAIGDMGAHLIDHSMWALDLGYPTTIETVSTPFNGVCFPHATMTFYEFPARGEKPPVKLTWYDGGFLPPKPPEMGDEEFNKGGGALLVGSKGKLLHDTYGEKPRLLPKSLHESVGKPPQKLPRIPNQGHEMNWVEAAKGKTQASSPFEYAAKLTEVMLLGVVSLRAGKKLEYDGANMRVTNDDAANQYLQRAPKGTSTAAI